MVIMTAKVSKRKMLLVLLLLVLAAAVLITCLKRADTPDTSQDTAEEIAEVATNEARVAFLEQFGWTVAEEPVQTQKVRVPEDPSEVFLRYNDLQLSQGKNPHALCLPDHQLPRHGRRVFCDAVGLQRQRRRRRRRFQPPERCDAWLCHAAGTDYGAASGDGRRRNFG